MNSNTDFTTSGCAQYEADLEDHLSANLGGSAAVRLSEHLKTCRGCQTAFDQGVLSNNLLRLAEPAADPGPSFGHMVMARIRTELHKNEGKSIWLPFVSMAWRFAATAVLALVVLGSFDLGRHNQWQQDQSLVATNKLPELVPEQNSVPNSSDDVLLLMAERDHGKQ
jgi:predicted anti-sigma-YlaC factor YlaD